MSFVYYYYLLLKSFSHQLLIAGLSLESEWQQVSSGIQDSSQYSSWSLQFRVFLWFPIPAVFFQGFGDRSKGSSNIWYHCHSVVPQLFFLFNSLAGSKYLSIFHFLLFSLCGPSKRQNLLDGNRSRRRKTLNTEPVKLSFKIDLVSHPARVEELVYIYIYIYI